MRQKIRGWCLVVVFLSLVPLWAAQEGGKTDKKKEGAAKKGTAVLKDDKKKDAAKKGDDNPDDKKKGDKTSAWGKEPEVVFGQVLRNVTVRTFEISSTREFAVNIMAPDAKKIQDFQRRQAQLLSQMRLARTPQERAQRLQEYQRQMLQARNGLTSPQEYPVKAAEKVIVRTLFEPQEFDEKGNLKKLTEKEKRALRGSTKLPGYPAELEMLRVGQLIDVYMAKTPTKGRTKIAKKSDDEDLLGEGQVTPEAVLIVIKAQPKLK